MSTSTVKQASLPAETYNEQHNSRISYPCSRAGFFSFSKPAIPAMVSSGQLNKHWLNERCLRRDNAMICCMGGHFSNCSYTEHPTTWHESRWTSLMLRDNALDIGCRRGDCLYRQVCCDRPQSLRREAQTNNMKQCRYGVRLCLRGRDWAAPCLVAMIPGQGARPLVPANGRHIAEGCTAIVVMTLLVCLTQPNRSRA
jgi:hypothetical protein